MIIGIVVFCVLGFLLVATEIVFLFDLEAGDATTPLAQWYNDSLRPEIAGMFLDALLFIGLVGALQSVSEQRRITNLKKSLNAPIEKMLAELMISFIEDENELFYIAARAHSYNPPHLKDFISNWTFELDEQDRKVFKEIIHKNINRLEAIAPASAQVSDKYTLQYLALIQLLDELFMGKHEINKATVVHILDLVEEMGGSYNKQYMISARLDKVTSKLVKTK